MRNDSESSDDLVFLTPGGEPHPDKPDTGASSFEEVLQEEEVDGRNAQKLWY